MKAPSIRARREAVERAWLAAPQRSSADMMQSNLLKAAAAVLGSLEALTAEQLDWLTTPEAQAAVRAAYRAAKGET